MIETMANEIHGNLQHLNWYPGHMKKTREMIRDHISRVDAVIEVVDARIPASSRNPVVGELIQGRTRILALNKSDLADPAETARWEKRMKSETPYVCSVNCSSGSGIKKLMQCLNQIQKQRDLEKRRKRMLRLMIVGVPNVGKSSLINRLTGRKSAQTGDRPGVTKGKQWLTLTNGMQLLDTPGILWPKFEDPQTGLNLAFCGSIKDEIMDTETLCLELIRYLLLHHRDALLARYKIETDSEDGLEVMEQIARKRGFIFSGKRIDYGRTAKTVLDEFRSGMIGSITLESCDDADPAEIFPESQVSGTEKESRV